MGVELPGIRVNYLATSEAFRGIEDTEGLSIDRWIRNAQTQYVVWNI